jgi:tRNA threonylcarbamoyladenosine biosynthesis protein TsaE
MNTDTTWHIESASTAATEKLGADIGACLKGGEVIELRSDLGGGKTTFVRGLARGAGSADPVGSPSFTISREYAAPNFTIHHYDFYRLAEPGLMAAELSEVLDDNKAVVIIEWADVAEDVLPKDRAIIAISTTGESERQFDVILPASLNYLKGDA